MSESEPTIPPKRNNPLKRFAAHAGLAVGTTLASLVAPTPQEVHSQESIIIPAVTEQSPEFLATEVSLILLPGKPVNIVEKTINIAPEAKIVDHFLGISDQLKNPLIVEQKNVPERTEMKRVDHPMMVKRGGIEYLVWFERTNDGSKKPMALALTPENWGAIGWDTGEESIDSFDKNQPTLPTSKIIVKGMAQTNYNQDLSPEIFGTNVNGDLLPIMRSLPPKAK